MVFKAALYLLTVCTIVSGQTVITRPHLGFVADADSKSFVPIHGVPGAAFLGPPVTIDGRIAAFAAAPRQHYVLASTAEDGSVRVFFPGDQQKVPEELAGVSKSPDHIAISPSGETAALYFSRTKHVEILTGLPSGPVVKTSVVLHVPAAFLAVSDVPGYFLAAVSTDSGPTLFLWNGRTLAPVATTAGVAAASFAPQSTDAAFLTVSGELWTTHKSHAIASGIASSARNSVAFSRNGKRVFVADEGRKGVWVFDERSDAVAFTSCNCGATGLSALNGDDLFWLNANSDSYVRLLDAGVGQLRIVTVPREYVE